MTEKVQISNTLRAWMDIFMHHSMRGWKQFAKSTGLSMPQIGILMQLHHKGPCGVSDISGHADITAAAASQLVEKLVQAGYIYRVEDPSDRRAKMLTISPTGAELLKKGNEERYRWMRHLADTLSEPEQDKVSEALTLLINAAKELEK